MLLYHDSVWLANDFRYITVVSDTSGKYYMLCGAISQSWLYSQLGINKMQNIPFTKSPNGFQLFCNDWFTATNIFTNMQDNSEQEA